ncbi:MAG: tripartite tricarboxylate transporter TctB family protein [Syntrophaceae bacterium]|nr:tripartite tricarboxylate transporter TctB family protein [Syntrophaceae bacterium]
MGTRDRISGVLWLLAAGFVAASGVNLGIGAYDDPGPGFLPFWSGLVLALLAVVLLVLSLWDRGPAEKRPMTLPGRTGMVVVTALALYCWLLPWLGYLVATTGLMLVLFGLGHIRIRTVVLGSLLAVFLSYVLFLHVLKVPLPRGILSF